MPTEVTMPEPTAGLVYNMTLQNITLAASIPPIDAVTLISVVCYALICWVGLIGNGLVVFVIGRYANMKTITNLYILNLSIADWLFLLGLPLIITTSTLKHWVFGEMLCKFYYIVTCILALIVAPSAPESITTGIVTLIPSAPPSMAIAAPPLLTITTATAPAF